MRIGSILTFLLVGLGSTGPARRDCGLRKCYDAVNKCGKRYGGCWTECANGVRELPTFTVPLCSSKFKPAVSTGKRYPVQTSGTNLPSVTSTAESLITTPPSPYHTKAPRSVRSRTCSPLWLCIDNLAVCGNSTQMYGGCYDVCTSRPPYTSPPCSLSSSTTDIGSSSTESIFSTTEPGYAIPTPAPKPGVAYTTDAPADSIAPAVDDSRALVMAEMPTSDASAPASGSPTASAPTPDAGELRIANVPAEQAAPTDEASEPIEAPPSLRGAAIAKLLADKDRKPKTENKPCWDDPSCKEVQLGIPSPLPSSVEASPGAAATPTAQSTPESSTELPADAPVETSSDLPAVTPTDTPTDTSGEPSVA
ncbi:hypothetical protein E8E12_002353 [Didymella heteroderae]|uniref:Uncharacterized protein n=1 Tax=Didymella heteroderae TaxID=1769908 RepID=A0A9P4WXH6_9PLEO|nr:hypothetical protein E8E12_002353 [Didymella heteroderae]